MELGLGTVQFGIKYGISNQGARTGDDEVRRILSVARECEIRVLDTAAAYGESESVLGRCFRPGDHFQVVTKTLPIEETCPGKNAAEMVKQSFYRSLDKLRVSQVHGLLVHRCADLLGPAGEEIWYVLEDFRERGLAAKIGVSVYEGREIDAAMDKYPLDLVQLPLNVLDQRLIHAGQLSRLKARGVEVHARSVFLQGILLMDPSEVPSYFDPVRGQLSALRHFLEEHGLSPAQGAFAFLRSIPEVDVVLTGVNDADQLALNIADFAAAAESARDYSCFAIDDERYVNPGRWKLDS